jgi:competence protein ComEC
LIIIQPAKAPVLLRHGGKLFCYDFYVKDIAFWSVIISVLAGVSLRLSTSLEWEFIILCVLVAFAVLVATLGPKREVGIVVALIIFSFGVGIARVQVADDYKNISLDSQVGEEIVFDGIVVMEPDERERTTRLVVETDDNVRIIASVARPADALYGQRAEIKGVLKKPSSFSSDGGREFNYPAFLAKDNILYELEFPEIEIIGDIEKTGWGRSYLFDLKKKYLDGLAQTLTEPHAALAGGITVGDKRALGGNLLEIFRITGIVHIVVLSGYNITIVAESIRRLLGALPRRVGLLMSAVAILFFVIMTGATATGVRAGAMASLAILASATNRRYAITRALAVTAVAMVLWSPHILLYDPGFQLSVLATLGLIHIAPMIELKLTRITEHFGLRGIFAATLGTQIAVLPLLLYQMGLLSLVALPVNLLILPAIPLAMLFSFIAGIAGLILGFSGAIFAAPAYFLLSYSLWVVEIFSKLPFASISVNSFSLWWVIGAYISLFFGIFKIFTYSTCTKNIQ